MDVTHIGGSSSMARILNNLHYIFYPKSVAVIGVSADPVKMGHHVLVSLVRSYKGKIYPINPKYDQLFGLKVYPSLQAVPNEVNLVIIVVPANIVPQVMDECGRKGVKGVIIITAGFKEIRTKFGEKLQNEVANIANKYGISVIGPNTFGVINLHANLNASFTPDFSKLKKAE